jgi:flagellar hook-basal body complex protein FliE
MIASERANLSLNLTVQVRNKLLEAYQEIMRMPL